jgi:hypothetical protein
MSQARWTQLLEQLKQIRADLATMRSQAGDRPA